MAPPTYSVNAATSPLPPTPLTSRRATQNDAAMRARILAAFLLLASFQGRATAAETLASLLQGVNDSLRPSRPLRAQGSVESDSLQGHKQDRLVLVERAAAEATAPVQVYVDFENAKVRVLALGPSDLN